jgi:hypothetical protein
MRKAASERSAPGYPSMDPLLGPILGLEISDGGNRMVRLGKSLEKTHQMLHQRFFVCHTISCKYCKNV